MLKNIVEETCNSPGTTTAILLGGAVDGRLPFIHPATFANGDTVFYAIRGLVSGVVQTEWGIGTVASGPPTQLSRTTVVGNSAGTTARLNFTGAVRVYNETLAEFETYRKSNGLLNASPAAIGGSLWSGQATANVITAFTPVPFEDGVKPGTMMFIGVQAAPTGLVTVSVNGGAASPLLTGERARQCSVGDFFPGDLLTVVWDGANWRLLAPAQPSLVPVGAVLPYTGGGAPSRYLWPDGRNVSRTTYPALNALYAASGYPFGAGNGSTTFGLPDLRGRVLAGRDDLGGVDAARITGVLGTIAWTLGGVGGSQWLHAHNHGVTEGAHSHSFTGTAHNHGVNDPQHDHFMDQVLRNLGGTGSLGGGGSITAGGFSTGNNSTGITIQNATAGGTVGAATTGLSVNSNGAGNAQNLQPMLVLNWILFAGT